MSNRQNYRLSLKAFFPVGIGNGVYRSGSKSLVRDPVNPEKLRRAKVVMIRLTKLIREDSLTLDGKCNITGKGLSLMWGRSRIYSISTIIINCQSFRDSNSQRSKTTHIGEKGTMGNPKDRKVYGFGGSVVELARREPGTRFYSSLNNIKLSGGDILKELREINKNIDFVNSKVIHIISNIDILMFAYESIKKSTPGNIKPRDDGASLVSLQKISSDLKAGKFDFSPVRKVHVLKRNKEELRSLVLISPRDKVVQTAMLMVLEAIFEPSFHDTSHGFRPGKGCHTALKLVKNTFSNVNWVIKGDISKFYDTIDHQILLNLIKKRISCEKTLTLIKKFFKNSCKDNGRLIYSKIGIFQGSSLSPLLSNICLHEFDKFMEDFKRSFNKGIRRRKTPSYRHVQHLLSYNKETLSPNDKKTLSLRLRSLASKDFEDPNFRRLQYVRYSDDFLVGIIGKHSETTKVSQEIKDFLFTSLSLKLNLDKSHITNFNREGTNFLSTFICGNQEKEKKIHIVQRSNKNLKVRSTSRARLEAPILKIFDKSVENGFFKRTLTGKFVPTSCGRVVNLDHADIIRFYNQKIRGVLNYYSFVDNKKSLGSFVHGLKHSCALTLALKFKLRHRSKVFKKFGKALKCPETEVELYIPKSFRRDQKFLVNPEDPKTIMEKRWSNKFTRSNLNKSCVICGEFPTEMHHLRNIKDLKFKYRSGKQDFWKTQIAAINRKQIPLCKKHHVNFHRNSLTAEERDKLIEAIKEYN